MESNAYKILERIEKHCGEQIKSRRLRFQIATTMQAIINERDQLMDQPEFNFDTNTGTITRNGEEVSPAFAREAWAACEVGNHNIAFQRLATQFEFDIDAALTWYATAP